MSAESYKAPKAPLKILSISMKYLRKNIENQRHHFNKEFHSYLNPLRKERLIKFHPFCQLMFFKKKKKKFKLLSSDSKSILKLIIFAIRNVIQLTLFNKNDNCSMKFPSIE